jgi:glycosyltransferase involved in cell wall biosynthesis
MKIAIIFKPYRPLRVPFVGGMMNYTYFLAKGLEAKGHKVTVFANKQAKLSKGVSVVRAKYNPEEMDVYHAGDKFYNEINNNCKYPNDIVNRSFGELSKRFDNKTETYLQFLTMAYQNFDLVHIVTHDIVGLYPALFTPLPTVISLHGHYDLLGPDFLKMLQFIKKEKIKHKCQFVSVSKYIKKEYSKYIDSTVIYNAVDIGPYKLNENKKDYLIWIGRIDYNKGLDKAVEIAIKLKQKLYFAGPIEDKYLYDTKIKKHVDGKNIKYLGILNEEQKNKYLGEAKAMFFPVRGVEAFGRVAIEALACGTPVITHNKGGLPEIVINNKTGFIIKNNNIADTRRALSSLDKISPSYCRRFVEDNFTIPTKTDKYEKLYKKVINKF